MIINNYMPSMLIRLCAFAILVAMQSSYAAKGKLVSDGGTDEKKPLKFFFEYEIGPAVLNLKGTTIDSMLRDDVLISWKPSCKIDRNFVLKKTVESMYVRTSQKWNSYWVLNFLHAAYGMPKPETFEKLKNVGFNISLAQKHADQGKKKIACLLALLDPKTHDKNFTKFINYDFKFLYKE